MRKLILLFVFVTAFCAVGCGHSGDNIVTNTNTASVTNSIRANSVMLALQPIISNIGQMFGGMLANERENIRADIAVSDALKARANGTALQNLIPVDTLDAFKVRFPNYRNVADNLLITQSDEFNLGLCIVSSGNIRVITRIISEFSGNAAVAVSYINDASGTQSTFAFKINSTGSEVSGRFYEGTNTSATYESNGYVAYVSGNNQQITFTSADGSSETVKYDGTTVSGGENNSGNVSVSSWTTVSGSSMSLSVVAPCVIPANSEDYEADVSITFSGSSVMSAAPSDYSAYATFNGGILTINAAGTYVLDGNLNGHIYIPNKLSNGVVLVLNGLVINGQMNGAIYSPKKTPLTIILPSGKTNTLNDYNGQYNVIDEDQGAVLQTKEAIKIMGSGSLTVNANGYIGSTDDYVNGIQAKGSEGIVYIVGGNVTVTSSGGNAIKGKAGVAISGGNITATAGNNGTGECIKSEDYIYITGGNLNLITAGGDAIKAENDWEEDWTGEDNSAAYSLDNVTEPVGKVYIIGGTINATAFGDGIQAVSDLEICGGNINITTTNSAFEAQDKSSKGIKSGYSLEKPDGSTTIVYGGAMRITGGTITVNAYDHGISSKGTLDIYGYPGINITARNPYKQGDEEYGGKGIKSVKAMNIGASGNPKIRIFNATEGIECKDTLTIKGGENYINSIDDGLNAGFAKVKVDGSGNYTKDQGNSSYGYTHKIVLAGGTNYIRAGGDGIDANGTITISGGLTLVSSSGNGDGCLDTDETIVYSGGVLAGSGAGNMGTSYPDANAIVINGSFNSGTYVNLSSSSGKVMTYAPLTNATHIVYVGSLNNGTTYTAYSGGSDTGTFDEGYSSGGTYSAGTSLGSVTYSGASVKIGNGQGGMGGQPSGMNPPNGGQPGNGGMGGNPPTPR